MLFLNYWITLNYFSSTFFSILQSMILNTCSTGTSASASIFNSVYDHITVPLWCMTSDVSAHAYPCILQEYVLNNSTVSWDSLPLGLDSKMFSSSMMGQSLCVLLLLYAIGELQLNEYILEGIREQIQDLCMCVSWSKLRSLSIKDNLIAGLVNLFLFFLC